MKSAIQCGQCKKSIQEEYLYCPYCGQSAKDEGDHRISTKNLFKIAHDLSSVSDLDFLLNKISAAAEKITSSETSSVMLLDERKEYLCFKTAGGEKGELIKTIKVPIGQGIAGWVARNSQPHLVKEVAKDNRFSSSLTDQRIGFKTHSILCVPLVVSGELIGVMEVLNKKGVENGVFSSSDQDVLSGLASFAAISIVNSKLNSTQKNFFAHMIEILTAAIELRPRNVPGHCWRMAQSACAIARRLEVSKEEYRNIYYATLLHDIGYIGLEKQAALKTSAYSREKIELLHPVKGEEMIEGIQLLKGCASLIRSHHEFWDGSGFPDGLEKEAIPLGARIISFLESIEDSRTENMNEEEYVKIVEEYSKKNSGVLFDPQVVLAYLSEISSNKQTSA